jgi:hypothetical protein
MRDVFLCVVPDGSLELWRNSTTEYKYEWVIESGNAFVAVQLHPSETDREIIDMWNE